MKCLAEINTDKRLIIQKMGVDGGFAYAYPPGSLKPMTVLFSWGGGWEHVSVSYKRRCPTWDEMCIVKDIFFKDDECVIQYHPPKSDYVNDFPYCLHLWRPVDLQIPMPPIEYV